MGMRYGKSISVGGLEELRVNSKLKPVSTGHLHVTAGANSGRRRPRAVLAPDTHRFDGARQDMRIACRHAQPDLLRRISNRVEPAAS